MKSYKLKYFRMIFHLLEYYQAYNTFINIKQFLICHLSRNMLINFFVFIYILLGNSKYLQL